VRQRRAIFEIYAYVKSWGGASPLCACDSIAYLIGQKSGRKAGRRVVLLKAQRIWKPQELTNSCLDKREIEARAELRITKDQA
jgi:hypothetical protein